MNVKSAQIYATHLGFILVTLFGSVRLPASENLPTA